VLTRLYSVKTKATKSRPKPDIGLMQGQGQDQDQDQQLDQRFVDKQIMKCFNILQHVTTKMLPIESSFRRYKVHRHILEEVTPSEGVK